MPSAITYIPPTDPARDAFSTELVAERTARRTRYLTALKYYNGEHPDQLDFDPDVEPDDNTTINLVKVTADRTASFLFPAVPKFETDPKSVEPTPEETWITDFLEANGGLATLIKLCTRGFLAGHTFVRVRPGKPRGRRKHTPPQMILLDPLSVTIYWSADDVGEVLWYENRYTVGQDVIIEDHVWRPEKGEQGEWEIYTYVAKGDNINYLNGSATPHGAGASGSLGRTDWMDYVGASSFVRVPTPDGHPFAVHASHIPPIIEFGHLPHPDDRYGHGEVTQTQLQDTINRLWSEINRIVRKHSNPVDVITGADVDDVEAGDDIMTVPQEGAKVTRLEMKGDLTAAVATVERLVKTYLALARVVLLEGEAKDLQRVTNASVRTLFIDALAKNSILQSEYGQGLARVAKLAMQMSGEAFAPKAADMTVQVKFSEALPTDKKEIADINAILVNLGARSLRTAATEIGDNWAFEQEAIEAETVQKLDRMVEEAKRMTAANGAMNPPASPATPKIVPKTKAS